MVKLSTRWTAQTSIDMPAAPRTTPAAGGPATPRLAAHDQSTFERVGLARVPGGVTPSGVLGGLTPAGVPDAGPGSPGVRVDRGGGTDARGRDLPWGFDAPGAGRPSDGLFGGRAPGAGPGVPGGVGPGLPGGVGPGGVGPGLPSGVGPGGVPGVGPGGVGPSGIPGMGRGGVGVPGGVGPGGAPGGLGRGGLPGAGGLGDFGGLPTGPGGRGGMPGFKTPGADRMDGGPNGGPEFRGPLGGGPPGGPASGGFGGGVFGQGTWDYDSKGLHGSGSAGGTVGGYGAGVNDRGEFGVATGGAEGGRVTSPGDAKAGAASAVGGSKGGGQSGVPEGLDWSHGTRVKGDSAQDNSDLKPKEDAPKREVNDLGPSTNEPAQPTEDDTSTAVAQNDDGKGTQAGRPNPMATPNPEDTGGGTPRSSGVAFGELYRPNPEDTGGGGTPRSSGVSTFGELYRPNPEDSGGGTPRSAVASVGALARAVGVASRA
jgi:hypothetical protein